MDGAPCGVGPQGLPFAGAVVDSPTTLDPGYSATVKVSFERLNVRFTLGQSADANYQQAQIQDLINKVDELINALRR